MFGKTLDYRNERTVGDIKYLWEINRHYELVTLAQAFHLSGEQRNMPLGCRRLLESWFEQMRYPDGQNWSQLARKCGPAVELGGGLASAGRRRQPACSRMKVGAISSGAGWIRSISIAISSTAHLSLHSSANNHLFGEYMGLFIGAVTWPLWPASAILARDRPEHGLERQALLQNAPDGVNREQAIWYQHEVADMMLLCALFGRANGVEFSGPYWNRLRSDAGIHPLADGRRRPCADDRRRGRRA